MKKVLLASLMLLGIVTNSFASVGDTFVVENLLYTVLTEDTDNNTGTVSVGKTTEGTTGDDNLTGDIIINETITYEGITYDITTLAEKAFYNCQNVTSFTIGKKVNHIIDRSFNSCINCTSVTFLYDGDNFIWDGVNHFGSTSTSTIETINLPKGIKTIPAQAFNGANSIKKLVIPEGVIKMEYSAINSTNTSLIEITLPSTIRTIDCPYFFYKKSGRVNINMTPIEWTTLVAKKNFFAYDDSNTFNYELYYNNEKITSITLPDNITSLPDGALACCWPIEEVNLNDNLTTIGTNAFAGTQISKIKIPSKVNIIPNFMCANCKNLTEVDLGNITTINVGSFDGCPKLKEIHIPESLTKYDISAFCQTASKHYLKNVYIDNLEKFLSITATDRQGITYEGFSQSILGAQDNSANLVLHGDIITDLVIPESITKINNFLLAQNNFNSITLPNTLLSIGTSAFCGSLNLDKIYIPESVTTIGKGAFKSCNKLKIINVTASINKIPDYFSTGSPIRQLVIPNSVTEIGAQVAVGGDMNHLTLPSRLTSIGYNILTAFWRNDHNIKEFTLPATLKTLSYATFGPSGTNNLTLENIFIMGDEIPDNLKNHYNSSKFFKANGVIYVKESVFNKLKENGTIGDDNKWNNIPVNYKIPVTMGSTAGAGSSSNFKSMCRDFDADFSDPNVTDPELKVWLAADYNGNNHNVMMQQLNYVPSRLKANVTDPETGELYQGVDEYVGVILEGTPGKTYYYKMGEHDYTQGAEGQWLLEDAQQNFLVGANDDHYVNTTTVDKETEETRINYGLKNGYFKKYVSEGFINYNKSFLSLPEELLAGDENYEENNAKGLGFEFYELDGTTRILSAEEFSSRCEDDIFNGRTYNLQGQAVGDDYKGFVIQNGKKLIRK